MTTDFRLNFTWIISRYPTTIQTRRLLRESSRTVKILSKIHPEERLQFLHKQNICVTLYKLPIPSPIELRLGNVRIQKSETVKYLGLVFDAKLDLKSHIQQLKSKCNKALNRMRSVSSTEWETDQKTLMMIYRSLIRSKVDYGCIVHI